MGIWYFWEQYEKALDKHSHIAVQKIVTNGTSSLQLDRETQVSRFLSVVQRMPTAWGSRPWSSHELLKAGNNVANELFRRRMKRELGIR